MKENITYVIVCRQGFNKLTCPFISQIGHCCECNNVAYIKREKITENTQPEKSEQEQND
jgi:hypothetical protein